MSTHKNVGKWRKEMSVSIDYDHRVNETAKAILFLIDGEEYWIPKSVIIDDDEEESGSIEVAQWFAEKEGLC